MEPALLLIDDPDAGSLEFQATVTGPDDGPAVLLLHGWPQSSRSWDAVVPVLASAGLHCVAVDQRGYSPGARPTGTAAYGLEHLVRDAAAFVAALGWERAHVVGHDWGAVVGWALAAHHPEVVTTLTALSIPHPAALAAVAATDPEQRNRLGYIEVLRAEGGVAERVLLADDALRLREVYAGQVPRPQLEAHVSLLTEPGALTAALEWYRAMTLDTWAALPPVTVPTTYVWGTTDIAVGPVAAAACQGQVHADYAFVPLPDRGHWLPEQAPDAVAEAILARVLGTPSAPG